MENCTFIVIKNILEGLPVLDIIKQRSYVGKWNSSKKLVSCSYKCKSQICMFDLCDKRIFKEFTHISSLTKINFVWFISKTILTSNFNWYKSKIPILIKTGKYLYQKNHK